MSDAVTFEDFAALEDFLNACDRAAREPPVQPKNALLALLSPYATTSSDRRGGTEPRSGSCALLIGR